MHIYRHRQVGWLPMVLLVAVSALTAAIRAVSPNVVVDRVTISVLIVAVLLILLFWSLTVEVDSARVEVWFGFGLIRRSFPVPEIREATKVRNPWYYGWGIRLTPRGWMFNVSGLDAVELTLTRNRAFRIGTDDPDRLVEAIRWAVQERG